MGEANPNLLGRCLSAVGLALFLLSALWGKVGRTWLALLFGLLIIAEWYWGFFRKARVQPYQLMIISPLLLWHFSSPWDFRIRIFSFFFLALIVVWAVENPVARLRLKLEEGKPAKLLALALAFICLTGVLLYKQGIYLSGDEPHYLLMAQSLVDDRDIDLKNNMAEKSYLAFHPVELDFHGQVINGRAVPFHMPGLALLLAPFYWLHSRILNFVPPQLFFRLVAGLLNVFFALGLFRLLKRQSPDGKVGPLWLLSIATFPLLFHSVHLYPELPAGTLLLFAFLLGIERQERFFTTGLLLAAIPWFHVKYALPTAVLALFMLWRLWRARRWKSSLALLLPLMASGAALLAYARIFYGSWNPSAIFPPADYLSASLWARVQTLLAFFLDQRDGLLIYAPWIMFFIFGFRRKTVNRLPLLLVFFSYLGFHAFTTIRGAYSPAGRPVMVVYWIVVSLVASFRAENPQKQRTLFRVAAGLSFFSLVWLFYHPLFAYQPVTAGTIDRASSLLAFFSSSWLALSVLFPSFLKQPGSIHAASAVWVVLLLALAGARHLKWRNFKQRLPRPAIAWLLMAVLAYLFCFWPHVQLSHNRRHVSRTSAFFNNSRLFTWLPKNRLFRIKAGANYDIFLDLRQTGASPLTFTFSNCDQARVLVWNNRRILFSSRAGGTSFSIDPQLLQRMRVGNFLVAHLGFETYARSPDACLYLKIE